MNMQRRLYFVVGRRLPDDTDEFYTYTTTPLVAQDNIATLNKPLISKNIRVEVLNVNKNYDGCATICVSGLTDKGTFITPRACEVRVGQYVTMYIPELGLDIICGLDNFEYVPANRTVEEDRRLRRNAVDRIARITGLDLESSDEIKKLGD